MKKERCFSNRSARVLPWLAVVVVAAVGCSQVKTVSETIYTGNGVKIRLVGEVEKESGQPVSRGLDHPWDVSIVELDSLLGSIRYQPTVMFFRGKQADAFPVDQRREMLGPIQEAFAKATPSQRVDFSFTERRKRMLMSRDMLTDGVLFREGGHFHCAFRNLALDDLADPEGSGVPFRGDPTREPVRSSWVIVLGPGQELVKPSNGGLFGARTFPNWVRLDLARTWTLPDDSQAAVTDPALEKLLAADPPGEAPVSRAEIERQLEFLEELRAEGAIVESAYEKKKQELADLLYQAEPIPAETE